MATSSQTDRQRVSLPDIVGRGYGTFWNFKGRYRAVKGSRASKKSKTEALNLIVRMMEYPMANALCVRRTYRTLKDSCYTELRWAIHRLSVDGFWACKESPLEMTYLPTGQKILFRGLDDPLKVTSITVSVGVLCWLWIEEAYEIASEADFNMLDESIRGEVPPGLFKQITLTFNPWNDGHWLKRRFFDPEATPDVLAMTTDYRCNEWLDEADRRLFEDMQRHDPRRYAVAGLGEWGVAEGLVYERWRVADFDPTALKAGCRHVFGLDYGYTNDPTAFIAAAVNPAEKVLYIYDEFYKTHMLNTDIAAAIIAHGFQKERIRADSAEPKSNDDLRRLGIHRIAPAKKGKDSILNGIARLQEYEMLVHPTCKNTLAELASYRWDTDRTGNTLNRPADSDNHLMDALRYAMEDAVYARDEATAHVRRTRDGLRAEDLRGGWDI